MANFLNPLNPTNFGLNVTGNFNNLSSAGTFRIPNSDLLNKINSKGGPSRDPIGTVQFSAGGGNFDSNPNIYIRDEELGEADNISVSSAGSGYIVANSVTTTTLTGSGSGLVINIVTVSGGGGISTVLIVNGGLGYVQGDTVSVVGGNGDAVLTIGIIDLPKNRLVLDSRSNLPSLQGAPISGLVLIPPTENPNASFIATDGTVAYFSRFATNYGYSQLDTITLNNPYGGTPAVVTVTGTPGINGQVGTANTSILGGDEGTQYQANDVLTQVSTSGVGRLFTCTVSSINGSGGITGYTVGLQYVKDFQGYTEGTGWQSFTSQGGVATAAGANTQLQFNNNGNLGANPGLTLDTSATPITLTSGISGGALSKNIFNSQEFTIEDTASGTARLHIESNQFAGSPAIELSHAPSNNLNAPGIKLSTTNFAGIALEVTGGQINRTSTSGQINTQTTIGSIRMRRGTASNYSTMEIQSGGDIFLETDVAGNQIRLITNDTNSSILLETKSTNAPIELKTDNSDIDLNAGQNITMDATLGNIELTASNGKIIAQSRLEVQTNTSVTTIDLDGSSDGVVTVGTNNNYAGNIKTINTKSATGTAGYAVRIGSDATNESGRIQLSNTTDQVTIDINGGDGTGNNQPYIRLTDFIGTASGKELQLRSLQQNRPCIEGFTSQGGANTMIIESNGGGSTGAAEHGQMIFSSRGNASGSIPVMKIERSDVSNDSTPTLQLQRPLRLWNAATANITNATTGLTQPGDMAYDTTTDCVKYLSNNGNILCLASGDQRILRVVQGSESLAKNYNASGAGATSWTGNPSPAYGGTGIGSIPLGPAGPPSIVGTIRRGTTFTNSSSVTPIGPAIQSAPGLGSEDCNIIYLGTGSGVIRPADGTPNFRPVLCCKCLIPERISATPTDLEYSLLVSGNLNIWADLSTSPSGSDKINFSLGVFATLADSIGMPNGGAGNGISNAEKRNNPYTGVPNPGGAAGTAYNPNYVSSLAGTGNDTTINGTGGGIGGLGTWPRPLHSSYYTNLTQTGNNGPTGGTGNDYRYASVGTFKNGTWTDPLGFLAGTPATGGGWGNALKGDPYQDTPSPSQNFNAVREGSGTMSVPFSLLCNNPNLDLNGGTWTKGPEREIYLWLCLGFNAGGNWDWLQVSKNGFGNSNTTNSFTRPPFFGVNSMKVTYLGAAAAASNGASSDA